MDLIDRAFLLVIGFLLTTVVGGFLGYFLKRRSWESQAKQDLHRARYDEGTQFLNDVSTCIGERYYFLQRLLWTIQEGEADTIKESEAEYFPIVKKWNSGFWRIRNKLRLLVNQKAADDFLDYSDDKRKDNPQSLHYHFVAAHSAILSAKNGPEKINMAEKTMEELNWHCSKFLESTTTEFLRRAAALQLLTPPKDLASNAEQANAPDAKNARVI